MTGRLSARELWSLATGTKAMARSTSGKRREGAGSTPNGGATTGYEAELWAMADALRGSMDAVEYKHVVLGLIFLKYISDAFEERRAAVVAEWGEDAAEDRDEYTAENIFWVPPEARWANLKAQARPSTIGLTVDAAMAAIERDHLALKDVLPRDYARPALDKQRLGQLIDRVSRAKMDGRDTRLPKDAANLFPERLMDSVLGKKPEGWRVGTLADVSHAPRRSIGPAEVAAETPHIGLEHMPRHSVALSDWGFAREVASRKSIFRAGEFLFGKLRPYFHACLSSPDFVEYAA